MMRRRSLVVVLLAVLVAPAGAQVKLAQDEQLWLEDVTPIMTRIERDVFLNLRTRAERDKFVVFFWKMRDTTPDTEENEFKKEYLERVRYADQTFGHESPKRGSQTERGYFYLLLGKPLERTLYTTFSQVWPCELWFYKGEVEYGEPAYFYLIFYQDRGLGDFRLYYPGIDGPERLAVPQVGIDTGKRADALKVVKDVAADLGRAAISYLPGEQPGGLGTSSDSIIASLKQVPEKKFSDAYARSYASYKDYVETEYADRYLSSAFQLKVFRSAGQPFVHWTIEPEKMNFAASNNTVYASFELVLRIEDGRGRPLFERTEEIPVRMTPDQYKAHERQHLAFQDLLPVIPGELRAFFLLKNKTAKDFSSFTVLLPVSRGAEARLTPPLLFHGKEPVPPAQRANLKAFTFDGAQYLVGARNEFLPSETLGIYFQAWDLGSLKLGGSPSFSGEVFSAETGTRAGSLPLTDVAASDGNAVLSVTGGFPLAGLKPGYYRLEVSASDPAGRKVLTEKENFVVLAQAFPVMPWVYARLHAPFPGLESLRVLATQYFMAGDYGQARAALERLLGIKDDPDSRQLLAKTLYGQGLFKESLAQAVPLYERVPDRETAKIIALDYAGLSDWTAALGYLDKVMAEATEVSVLNLAAQCHLNLNHPDKALPLLQKSLSLLPDQPSIRDLEEKTRRRLGLK